VTEGFEDVTISLTRKSWRCSWEQPNYGSE